MRLQAALRYAFFGLLGIYPFIVYFGIRVLPASFFGLLLGALVLGRFAYVKRGERLIAVPVLSLLLAYAVAAAMIGREQALLYYPVLVNLVLSVVFAASLATSEPLLLRLVRARGIRISDQGPRYLTRLTAVWAGFFVVNGLVALWTTTASIEAWALYNGLISYFLIALLLGVEWLYRGRHQKRLRVDGSRAR